MSSFFMDSWEHLSFGQQLLCIMGACYFLVFMALLIWLQHAWKKEMRKEGKRCTRRK